MWSRVRLTKIQATTRPDYLWLETWSSMSKAAHKKEKQEWAIEKTKLENARRLRGIHFTDPEDGEYKESFQKTQGKVGDTDGGGCAMYNGTRRSVLKSHGKSTTILKTKHACVVEPHESTKKAFGIYTT